MGIIGLGSELDDGKYGPDDFDLLRALGTQAASALLAVHMAEQLVKTREQIAWDNFSAFGASCKMTEDFPNGKIFNNMLK
ncbi:MAG: hypothetical protein MUO63_11185 [Desulfobulbaceae bacterium]|nr:hypothetical protein [Desulfobulbaceae bacterium]